LTDTNICENLITYFISTSETETVGENMDMAGVSDSFLVALLLQDIVGNDPAILVKLLHESSPGTLGGHFVHLLLSDDKTKNINMNLSAVVVKLINNVLSSNDDENLTALAGSLVDSGILEVIQKWAGRASISETEHHEDGLIECGLMVLELALHLKDCSILEDVGLHSIIPVLVKLLMDNPSAKFASLLTRINKKALRRDDNDYIAEQFLEYPTFKEAVDKENETIRRQRSDGDVIFNRVRGLPQEVECSRKYHVSFGDTWATVAVQPDESFIHSAKKLYFEVEILHTKGEGRIGWISRNYEHGELLDGLVRGIGEDEESWAYQSKGINVENGVTTRRSWKKNDFIGVLADLANGKLRFSVNGNILKDAVIQADKDKIENGILPAVSANRMECQINLGSKPFKHSPPMDEYVPFKNSYEY